MNNKSTLMVTLVTLIASSAAIRAATITPTAWDIAVTPLFLAKTADPLITLIWDDSGSMLVENSPESEDYANFAFPVSFSSAQYYATAQFGTGTNSKLVRDPKQNALFFDPFKTYKPWIQADKTLLPNATYTALWKSPFKTHPDDQYISANSKSCTTLNLASTRFTPCYKYTYCNGYTNCTTGKKPAFVPGDMYYNGKAYSLKTTTATFAANYFYTGSPAMKASDMLANAANWYTYYRDRKNTGKAALSYALQDIPDNINIGFTTFSYAQNNPSSPLLFTHRKFTSTNKQPLFDAFFNESNAGATPMREALLNVNNYIKNTDSLWYDNGAPLSCRRAYNIIITDGSWSDGTISFTKNSDGTSGPAVNGTDNRQYSYDPAASTSYQDSYSATLADIAMEYWKTDLRPDLDNLLYAPEDNKDQAFWQHIVTNSISLVDDVPSDIPSTWPNVILSANAAQRYMDLWHASLNSKGNYLLSTNFDSTITALKSFLNDASNLTSNVGYINTGLAVNNYKTASDSKLFKTFFNPISWSGEIKGYSLDTNGNVLASVQPWVASSQLPAPANRQMIAMLKVSGLTVPKAFNSTSLLQALPAAQVLSDTIINYYRGDRSQEGYQYSTGLTGLRARSTPLGDFINAKPVYVGAPSSDYSDTTYTTFKTANASRTPVLYAASNSGFLHGFNANTGVELFSVIPQLAYNKLAANSVAGAAHSYGLDATPRAGDAYFNNQWNTILVTPMGAGGQGIFSINITNPTSITEASAASLVGNGSWQFDDTNDVDMGYAYSEASISRVSNSTTTPKWAVIFGNGYNNTSDAINKSLTGNAVLFVLNAQDGSVIRKIDTGVGASSDPSGLGRPNGLSTPTVVDYDNDGIADYVYAGDIFGNVWKFDIRSSTPASWTAVKLFSNTSSPMQSITSAPDVKKFTNGQGIMVYVGTGKFIGSDDMAGTQKNSIYGILDNFSKTGITPSQLTVQTATNVTNGGVTARTLSSNAIDWSTKFGWVINLPTNELILNKPRLSQGYLLLSSYIPDPNNTVCVNNQKGYVYAIDPTNGGSLLGSAIDINNDGVIDNNDLINNLPVSGIQINTEYSSSPLVMQVNDNNNKLLINTQKGSILSVITARSYADPKQRSWKKVRSTAAEGM